jgi:hypothetical protein
MNGNKHRKRHGSGEGKGTLELFPTIGSLAVAAHETPIASFKNSQTNSEQCRQN